LTNLLSGPKLKSMSGSALQIWLRAKQRKALLSAYFYFAITSVGGAIALLPTLGVPFLICKLLLLLALPAWTHPNLLAAAVAALLPGLLFVDCRRAERDDMSIIPLWLAREFFHIGPRLMFDGWQSMARARQFARIDTESCAEVVACLLSKTTATTREELSRAFPSLQWHEISPQLQLIDGVVLFRTVEKVSLVAPLRLELRQLLAATRSAEAPEEPQAIPVDEPQRLSAREILGVSDRASLAEIKIAYRNRVKECHPDRFSTLDEESRRLAEEWTKAINAAYASLLAQRSAR
jgi:hypothetical protein